MADQVVQHWECPKCHEVHALQFDACWCCGSDCPDVSSAEAASIRQAESLVNSDNSRREVRSPMFPRYSLRHLLIGVTAICVVLGIYVAAYRHYTFADRVVASLRDSGGCFMEKPGEAHVLVWGLVSDPPQKNFDGGVFQLGEKDINNINNLPDLVHLSFSCTDITDELIGRVRPFKGLERLRLFDTRITFKGVNQLPAFPRLKVIEVSRDQVPPETELIVRSRFPGIQIRKLD